MNPTRGVRAADVRTIDDIRAFFDRLAPRYGDGHGNAERNLRYRIGLIERELLPVRGGRLVEIGCGTGDHIAALAADFSSAVGTDFSAEMVRAACARHGSRGVRFRVDDATLLATFPDSGADAIVCVGALEHVPDKPAVFREVFRVLAPGGRFVCLTVNGAYLWHASVGPALGFGTRHLASDRFLTAPEAASLGKAAGFERTGLHYWSFVPRADLPKSFGLLLGAFDFAGKLLRLGRARGGLLLSFEKAHG